MPPKYADGMGTASPTILIDEGGPPSLTTPKEIALLYRLLVESHKKLVAKDVYTAFRAPITDDIAPSYSIIIKNPMDFTTMGRKIKERRYTRLEEYEADFKLLCDNCGAYNGAESEYGKISTKLYAAGAGQKNSVLRKAERDLAKGLKDIVTKMAAPKKPPTAKRKANAVDKGYEPPPKRKKTGGPLPIVRSTAPQQFRAPIPQQQLQLQQQSSGQPQHPRHVQGAPRATLEIAAPQSAEELFRHQAFQAKYEAEASLILAHAEEKAGEAQRALRKAKSRPIGCMAVAGDRLSGKMVFQELADTRLGQASVQPPDEWVRPSAAASAAVAAGDQAQRPAYTFLHKNEAYAHGLRNSIAWDGGKAEDLYLGYLGDPEPVVLTESGPPMFDNEVEEYVGSLQRFVAEIDPGAPAQKRVKKVVDRITLSCMTANPEFVEMPEPSRSWPAAANSNDLPKDMRDKKTYFVTLRDSIPVIGFLNNQLKGRLVKRDTLIPGEEVQIAKQLVKTLIELQQFVTGDE